jgi:hypothetical protein
MTAQVPEILILDDEEHGMCTEPLARYLRPASIDGIFRATNSACWRGYPASEKLEIIRIVEQSHLPARRTLDQLGIARRTFYRWYDRYRP